MENCTFNFYPLSVFVDPSIVKQKLPIVEYMKRINMFMRCPLIFYTVTLYAVLAFLLLFSCFFRTSEVGERKGKESKSIYIAPLYSV